jgi:glycerophosphoryl diester phosphodiesterase
MLALDNGMALGADGLEYDVQLSSDGIPVVIHDQTLDRTTDRVGPVSALTAAELARVDAGYRFEKDGTFPFRGQGLGVSTLDEVMKKHAGVRTIIEMKGGQPELARAVAAAIYKADAVDWTCVGSFYTPSITAMRAEHPRIYTSASTSECRWALHRSWVRWPWPGKYPYFAFQLPEMAGRMRVVSPALVQLIHRQGHHVQVWVVNEPADVRRLLDWGVDGIISDRPDVAVATRDAWLAKRS